MIRYALTRAELERRIEEHAPGWLAKAKARTATFKARRKYAEKSSIWSEVKPVYMTLQGESKCAYCERKLESVDLGKGEQDVEHFRPKGSVRAWKASARLAGESIPLGVLPKKGGGYYLLPYHVFNYCAACKPCNSALKSDHFPIAGAYRLTGADPKALASEGPYLVYPIGDVDDDPESLITFYCVSPQAVVPRSAKSKAKRHARARALVTIDFFGLDDALRRKNLVRERAEVIIALYPQLRLVTKARSADGRARARRAVQALTSDRARHANCARSFQRLFATKPGDAEEIFDAATELVISMS